MTVPVRLELELLPKGVGKAVVAGEPDLQRVGRPFGKVLLRPSLAGIHRGFVNHHRMHGVVEVLEKDLPIGAEEDAEAAADDLELAGGSAVDHVVERRAGVTEI